MLRQETKKFPGSKNLDGSPMYPGLYTLTWFRFCPGVWMLLKMERIA